MQNIIYTKFNKVNTIQQYKKPVLYAITYGPDEQRVKTVYTDTLVNTTIRYYAGNYEKDTTNGTAKRIHYITAGIGLVAVYIKWTNTYGVSKDTLYYVCTDRQGSITALFKQDRKLAERYSYDAYGRRRNPANWTDYNVKAPRLINRGYTGHEMLDGFGLINMNGRMYDPVIGRVLCPDIAVQAPGYTQSYNRYSYCMNNPLKYTDPSGWYVAYGSCTTGRIVYGPNINLCSTGNYDALEGCMVGFPDGGGGGGGCTISSGGEVGGRPGQQGNGKGLNGVYYDWSTEKYRSTAMGNLEVSWLFTFNNSILPAVRQEEQARLLANIQLHPLSNNYGLMASVGDPPGGMKKKLPTMSENMEEVITAASISLSTATGCAIECPPIAAVLGTASISASSVLLYNSIATQYNNENLHWSTSNILDGLIYVGSAIDPIFGAISTWLYIVPSSINKVSK